VPYYGSHTALWQDAGGSGSLRDIGIEIGTTKIARFTTSGKVGIGTTTPVAKLQLGYKDWLMLDSGSSSGDIAGINFYEAGSRDATNVQYGASIKYDGGNDLLKIVTRENNVDKLGIAIDRSSGKVGIGTTTPSRNLHVVGNAGKTVGGIYWDNLSDTRLKDIMGEINNGLEITKNLRPVKWTWNSHRVEKFGPDPGIKYGFIAQEIREVIPEFVSEDDEGYMWYNPSGIEAILTSAIQEQQSIIEKQQQTIVQLKGIITQTILALEKHGINLNIDINELSTESSELSNEAQKPEKPNVEVKTNSQSESMEYKLYQNYPNPSNPTTTIQYQLPQGQNVRITIYDITGRKVKELVNEFRSAGEHIVQWDGKNQDGAVVANGTYIYRIEAGDFVQTYKLLLLK
jgi:hypothetical protein